MAWKNKPSNFSFNVKADAEKLIKNIAADVAQGVVMATPVDTGAARGNWKVSSTPDTSYNNTTSDKSGQGALQKAFVFISQNAKLGSVIYIQNNLPYIERLEDGYSQQAPSGMLSTTMTAVRQKYGG